MGLLIGWRCDCSVLIGWTWRRGGSLIGDVTAHWLEMWWFIGWRCDFSLVGYVVAPCLFEGVVAHCLEILLLIGWRCEGSLIV